MSIKKIFHKLFGTETENQNNTIENRVPSRAAKENSATSEKMSAQTIQSGNQNEENNFDKPNTQNVTVKVTPRAMINPMPVSEPKRVKREVGAEPKVDMNKNLNRTVVHLSKFQFQNLVSKPIMFAFFDLRGAESVPRFAKAMTLPASEVVEKVKSVCPSKDYPIVIICEDGVASSQIANEVFSLGYYNVYTLDGGTKRLLGDLPVNPIQDEED